MGRFPSLPERPVLSDVFKRFPAGVGALLEYHDILLRGPSPLSIAQRETLAAYVSALNACQYCFGAHRTIAEVHGVDPDLLDKLIQEPRTSGVDGALLPLFSYVRKLTDEPSRVTEQDAAAVYAAGWDEQALFDAVAVCALFNFMNRIVEGCGVVTNDEVTAEQRSRYQSLKGDPESYRKFGRRIGVLP